MSKASQAVKRRSAAEAEVAFAREAVSAMACNLLGKGDIAAVTSDGGCALACQNINATEALVLGRWLIDTFGEGGGGVRQGDSTRGEGKWHQAMRR